MAALSLLVGSCTSSVHGAAEPNTSQPLTTRSATPTPAATSAERQPAGCTVTARRSGDVQKQGPGQLIVTDRAVSFSCGSGPLISFTRITPTGVTFESAGGPVTIRARMSAAVGPYQVTVVSITSTAAVMQTTAV